MTSTHVYIGTSLDGFIARRDGSFDWLSAFADREAMAAYKEFMAGIDVIVLGRGTFDIVSAFPVWPYEQPVVVLTRSPYELPIDREISFSALDPGPLMAELATKGYRAAYIDGGKIIQSFLNEDLIDEMIIARVPVMIGDGIPLFAFVAHDLNFEHKRTRVYDNGLIRSYYRRRRLG
jgi:dihydrofolate reductase